MITAEDVRDTVVLLVPGFVALKLFTVLALNIRRTQFEWTIWSLVASAAIAATLAPLRIPDAERFWPAMGIAIALGILLTVTWRVFATLGMKAYFAPKAWDVVLDPAGASYVLVTLENGEEIIGWPTLSAATADTDDLDVYLTRAELVAADGSRKPFMNCKGVLIPRSQIQRMQILRPGPPIPPVVT